MTWIRSAILRTRGLLICPSVPRFHYLSSETGTDVRKFSEHRAGFTTGVVKPARASRSGARDLLHLEGLHDVALLDVVEPLQDQTALEALADLGDVVLLALQGRE